MNEAIISTPTINDTSWTTEELEETLYRSDADPAFRVINEIKYVPKLSTSFLANDEIGKKKNNQNGIQNSQHDGKPSKKSNVVVEDAKGLLEKKLDANPEDEEEKDEEKDEEDGPPAVLDLDLSGGQIHIVEFYAPWCPHCQAYKPHFAELATELNGRAISQQITFHAVSCTLNEDVCHWYEVNNYPTVIGWGGIHNKGMNITKVGIILNEYSDFGADSIAVDMQFDIAEGSYSSTDKVKVEEGKDEKFSNSTDQKEWDTWKEERIKEVVEETRSWLEFDHAINDRYHNAAASLAYVLRTGVYISKKGLSVSQQSALREFIGLVEWATPLEWNVRSTVVRDLYDNFDQHIAAGPKGKDGLVKTVERYQSKPLTQGLRREELLWGYIDENQRRILDADVDRREIVKRPLGAEHGSRHVDANVEKEERISWTSACNNHNPNGGFTCGLWDLFHILTIGASQTQNQLHGFRQGNVISSKEVASIIRNFIENFFRCGVCKNNFLKMYDECGHDHCNRLGNQLSFLKANPDESQMELALWFWEVHNAVNVRLTRELANRESRAVTKEELIASKFPTRDMCKTCFLDNDMENWDRREVFKFLQQWYWPSVGKGHARSIETNQEGGTQLSTRGLLVICTPLCLLFFVFVKDFCNKTKKATSRKNE